MPLSIEQIEQFFCSFHRRAITNDRLTSAGVLLLLTEQDDELSVLFTQRTEIVEHHKGQISFPGGAMDVTDATIVDTALREDEEEIGLPRSAVRVLGVLDDFETPSGFCMTPVVGYAAKLPVLHLHQAEVAEMFLAPLSFFLDGGNERIEQRERSGKLVSIYFYQYHNHLIWGATAAILRSFLYAVRDAANSQHHAKTL
jgi:8-oxo-dGTP pyrophosphatase MutT (NUDIX family)